MELDGSDSIWDLVVSFVMYDPMALLAVVPAARKCFAPTKKIVNGTEHWIIGICDDDPGVNKTTVEMVQDFLYTQFFAGLTLDHSEFDNTINAATKSEELARRELAQQSNRHMMSDKKQKKWGQASADHNGSSGS